MAAPSITFDGVDKSFNGVPVLQGIDLHIGGGELVCVVGRSGAGKTTLLRCIAGLETVDRGSILIDGRQVAARARQYLSDLSGQAALPGDVGMVFQQLHLWPHRTILDNIVEAPRLVQGLTRRRAVEVGRTLLRRFGLEEKAGSFPDELSVGEQQRVAIARTVATEPKLLLLDEITSGLDPELVADILDLIRGLAEVGRTMVLVTHAMKFASDVADRLVFLSDGRVREEGSPGVLLRDPKTPELKRFLRTVVL